MRNKLAIEKVPGNVQHKIKEDNNVSEIPEEMLDYLPENEDEEENEI